MNPSSEDQKPTDNMELLKQQASNCGPGCDCHATGPAGRGRWILGVIVLLAAAALVARAVVKNNAASKQPYAPAFVMPVASEAPGTEGVSASASASGPVVGREIGALSELNAAAADVTAVFVFLSAKGQSTAEEAADGIEAARRTIEANGATKIGVFTLKTDSPDYNQLSRQFTLPGVIALVKGRGGKVVSGEITETNLVQAFVAASSASGCAPGACCPAGCN